MSSKVLVADDSLTIQKVVGITLANENFELVQCLNESDLISKIKSESYALILLDFNLAEGKSGYELAEEVKRTSPSSALLAMLGTFDAVDDSALEQVGIQDKIVKPFESSAFIEKCHRLIDEGGATVELGDSKVSAPKIEESAEGSVEAVTEELESEDSVEIGDEWNIESPKMEDKSPDEGLPDDRNFLEDSNPLESQLKGWGMDVPNVIGINDGKPKMPPQMSPQFTPEVFEDAQVPSESDLDYPDMDTSTSPSTPALTPLEDLNLDDAPDADLKLNVEATEEELSSKEELRSAIEDDVSTDDFWAVDDEASSEFNLDDEKKEEPKVEITMDALASNIEEEAKEEEPRFDLGDERPSFDLNHESQPEPQEQAPTSTNNIDQDALVASIIEKLTPMIEASVKQFCEAKIEQVAWEIIPDLAENLIRTEIKEISDAVRPQ